MVLVPTASWVGQAPWPRLPDRHARAALPIELVSRAWKERAYGAVDGAMAYLVCTAPCLEDQWSPHIPGPEELGHAGLLGSKGQPTMAQAGLTLFHSQTSSWNRKTGLVGTRDASGQTQAGE